jgi:hypothetical protein
LGKRIGGEEARPELSLNGKQAKTDDGKMRATKSG